MPDQGISLCITVPTFRRVDQLKRLLASLNQAVEAAKDACGDLLDVVVVVIDNDYEGSARRAIPTRFSCALRYVVEQKRGLAAVRNRALDESKSSGLVLFVDDDMICDSSWIVEFVIAWITLGRPAALAGRTVPLYERPSDLAKAIGAYTPGEILEGEILESAATSNLLLSSHVVHSRGVRFNEGFGRTGGEDTDFTMRLRLKGELIRFASQAVAYEPVPAARLNWRALLRREVASGNTWVWVQSALGRGHCSAVELALGCGKAATGGGQALVGMLIGRREVAYRGVGLACRGYGEAMAGGGYMRTSYGGEASKWVKRTRALRRMA